MNTQNGANGADRWLEVERLFTEASRLPPEDRAAFLQSRCTGDSELLNEVDSLLRFDTGGVAIDEVLEESVRGALTEEPLEATLLGPWRVERVLGRGGMSIVYLATRADGQFARRVAIKLIKRGMDTAAVIERLRRERRILAALDHPGIARLLDGGSTETGLPYIVVDYVEGLPIHKWCDDHSQTVEQRCELMARVCDAVAYAHRSLVIHRDLKPGNILVDDEGNPRLLDFGIAKVLNDDAIAGPDPDTRSPFRLLTPEYASPEHIAGLPVGMATDVYSIGVVLYELLTGVRPGPYHEKASVAALRKGKSPRWAKKIAGDLDTILQVALRPEPERRYAGAGHFADDLRRYLNGMPVAAREETLLYRCRKFVGRHRAGVALAAALSLLTVFGASLYIRQERLAARRFDDLHQFASSFLFEVDDQLRDTFDSTAARAVVAQKALGYLNGLAVERTDDRQLRREAGNAWKRLGDLQGDPLGSSLGDTASARNSYQKAIAILGTLAESESGTHRADDICSDLVNARVQLARLERVAGETALAGSLIAQALAVASEVGDPPDPRLQDALSQVLVQDAWVQEMQGKIPAARDLATRAVGMMEEVVRRKPEHAVDLAHATSLLAATDVDTGDYRAALAHLKRSLGIRQDLVTRNPRSRIARRNLMMAWGAIGDVEIDEAAGEFRDVAAGLSSYGQMVSVGRELVASDASDRTARMDLAIGLQSVGDALALGNQPRLAIARLEEAVAIFDDLRHQDSGNRRVDENRSFVLRRMGEQYLKLGEVQKGREALTNAITTSESILARDPTNADLREYMLWEMEALADSFARGGELPGALALVTRIEATATEVGSRATTETRRASVPDAWEKLGHIFEALHDTASARYWYERSLRGWEAMSPLSERFSMRPAVVEARLQKIRVKGKS